MITKSKLEIYCRYKGDGDMFARSGTVAEKEIVDDAGFYLIDLLLQDATVLNRNLGSEQRNAEAATRLKLSCETDDVVRQIKLLAEKW